MTNFGDAFTIVQSLMTFLIVTDVFYERIIQNKLLPRISTNVSLLGVARSHGGKTACGSCLLGEPNTAESSPAEFPGLLSVATSGNRARRG